jgi:predicted ATPase with chaperone activity
MLARRLTTILPAMPLAAAIETTRMYSITGLTPSSYHSSLLPSYISWQADKPPIVG